MKRAPRLNQNYHMLFLPQIDVERALFMISPYSISMYMFLSSNVSLLLLLFFTNPTPSPPLPLPPFSSFSSMSFQTYAHVLHFYLIQTRQIPRKITILHR